MATIKVLASFLVVQGAILLVSGAIGGRPTKDLEGTSFVQIFDGQERLCGGTLLNRRWVMTNAYYVYDRNESDLTLTIGSQTVGVDWVVTHPNFTGPRSVQYLVALLRLEQPVRVGDPKINAVDGLPTLDIEETIKSQDRRCYYVSKGIYKNDNGVYQENQELTKVPVYYLKRCKNAFNFFNIFERSVTCIKSASRGDLPCEDSGAAIMCRHQGKWYPTSILGLWVVENACGSSEMASLNVAVHSRWINSVISS